MGKIRVRTLGDEEKEKKEKKQAKIRAEVKKASDETENKTTTQAAEEVARAEGTQSSTHRELAIEDTVSEKKQVLEPHIKTKKEKTSTKTQKHSKSYRESVSLIDKNKKYTLAEALTLLTKLKRAKFDETVELHFNTIDKGISGNFVLPHGTGKTTRITILNHSKDAKKVEETIKQIEAGTIGFDILIATPDTMPRLAKVARILGPRGLMPNPKNGTVTPKPEEIAKKFESGQINFKTEAKFPILHLTVGKLSFGDKKLSENITVALSAIQTKNIKTATLKSTMSPGIKLDIAP